MSALVLDAGALIAIDRGDPRVWSEVERALRTLCAGAGNKAVVINC